MANNGNQWGYQLFNGDINGNGNIINENINGKSFMENQWEQSI